MENNVTKPDTFVEAIQRQETILSFSTEAKHFECSHCRLMMLKPFGASQSIIGAGEEVVFTAAPQSVFKAKKLMIDTGNVDRVSDLQLVGLFFGVQRHGTVNIGSIPARAFANVPRDYETCQIGMLVTLILMNKSETPVSARAWFEGVSIR